MLHLDPGESLKWAGRGRRAATALALLPILLVMLLVLGLFIWAFLSAGPIHLRVNGVILQGFPEPIARALAVMPIAAIAAYYLWMVIRRVATAPRWILAVSDRRAMLLTGKRTLSMPLADIAYAEVKGSSWHSRVTIRQSSRGKRDSQRFTAFGVANVEAAIAELSALGIAIRNERAEPPEDRPAALAIGEAIRWSGRRGIRAFDARRRILTMMCLPIPLLFLWLGYSTWQPGIDWVFSLMLFLPLCAILGPVSLLIVRASGPFFDDLLVDTFGRLAVTDRRIIFTYPLTGTIDREIVGESLIDASLVDLQESGRGDIALTLAGKRPDDPVYVDLFGVPDAEAAMAAIARLVRPR